MRTWVTGFVGLAAAGLITAASVKFTGVESPVVPAPPAAAAAYTHVEPMGGHMAMSIKRAPRPGDSERAQQIVDAARKFAEKYKDYKKAEADGFVPFLPNAPQPSYHFIRPDKHFDTLHGAFDPERISTLIYEKTSAKGKVTGYTLVGVMYIAPPDISEADLDARIPLSIAQWHLHKNLCTPPKSYSDAHPTWAVEDPTFGLSGSIVTAEACKAADGSFKPRMYWMIHVYPFHDELNKIWNPGMDEDHGDGEIFMPGMPGMKLHPGADSQPAMKMSHGTKMDPNMKM